MSYLESPLKYGSQWENLQVSSWVAKLYRLSETVPSCVRTGVGILDIIQYIKRKLIGIG